jgi:hypothetical protein
MFNRLILLALFEIGFVWSLPGAALPFVEDDYAKALADARSRQVPLFVEAWAPW